MKISEEAIERIKKINELSNKLNGSKDASISYTLESIKHHAEEINQLFSVNNQHWAVETGNLIVHCMKMLEMYGFDLNEMFDKCCQRFENKLTEKLKEKI